ncbi:MAG: hypothetical protein A2537_01430 [Candidatus Magasanikbacteria bacterium RIFOXYD2_FULL_36_9]|uniref:Uncharacterized protein n=1 Tax=Candidatus Magasanikbacteria bacterium RIFOXYD2_FULL_36_9 TaxID=1798707 RepID=A0A1F6P160_9BACT|nr:MAG: hypothetical protein A2537_01430 [Candidatus Magasanikbacteria bacterium RIFOXYD2_FULL_36_9]
MGGNKMGDSKSKPTHQTDRAAPPETTKDFRTSFVDRGDWEDEWEGAEPCDRRNDGCIDDDDD